MAYLIGADLTNALAIQATLTNADLSHANRSEEHTSELQSRQYLVCRLLLEKKKKKHSLRRQNHFIAQRGLEKQHLTRNEHARERLLPHQINCQPSVYIATSNHRYSRTRLDD